MVLALEYSDILSIAQTLGIIGTLLLTLYFSKREIKGLSVDIETKVLSDLGDWSWVKAYNENQIEPNPYEAMHRSAHQVQAF